jgi:hypothetical protein
LFFGFWFLGFGFWVLGLGVRGRSQKEEIRIQKAE